MMTRKKFLIPLSIILITLLPLIGCSLKDDGNKAEPIDYGLLKNATKLYLRKPSFEQLEELKHVKGLSELEIYELKDLSVSEHNGTLNFASYLPNLERLYVETTYSTLDISSLSGSKLRELSLFVPHGRIDSLEPLSGLSELTKLVIDTAGALTLEPLAQCSSLKTLSLFCASTDITPLAALPSLWSLYLGAGAPDLSGLEANRSLKELNLVYSSSKGLEALGDVPLINIDARYCESFRLEQLKGLNTVETIGISDEYIDDITILSSMDNIKSIYLATAQNGIDRGTIISSEDAPELDFIVTSIPVNQLREFLSKEGTSITLLEEWTR